jgi:hypothetical protein
LQQGLAVGRWRSVPQLQRWLAQTHGIVLALSSLYDRLGKMCAVAGPAQKPRQKRPRRQP